jgi:hypothetical protein
VGWLHVAQVGKGDHMRTLTPLRLTMEPRHDTLTWRTAYAQLHSNRASFIRDPGVRLVRSDVLRVAVAFYLPSSSSPQQRATTVYSPTCLPSPVRCLFIELHTSLGPSSCPQEGYKSCVGAASVCAAARLASVAPASTPSNAYWRRQG